MTRGRREYEQHPVYPCHSHGRALIVVSNDREVEVDLENIRTDRDVTALAARFFAPQEQAAIMSAGSSAKHWACSRIWVAQEAVLKAGGSGLTFPLECQCIELSADQTASRLIVAEESLSIVPPVIQFLPLEEGWGQGCSRRGKWVESRTRYARLTGDYAEGLFVLVASARSRRKKSCKRAWHSASSTPSLTKIW